MLFPNSYLHYHFEMNLNHKTFFSILPVGRYERLVCFHCVDIACLLVYLFQKKLGLEKKMAFSLVDTKLKPNPCQMTRASSMHTT